jgi:PAS domain-containing protein
MLDHHQWQAIKRKWAEILPDEEGTAASAQHGYLQWETRTGQTLWDTHWAELFGLPLKSHTGTAGLWEQAIHPHDQPEVMDLLNDHLNGLTENFEAQYRLASHCDQPHSISTYGRVIVRRTNGRPSRIIMISHKIAALEYTKIRPYESPLSHTARQPTM